MFRLCPLALLKLGRRRRHRRLRGRSVGPRPEQPASFLLLWWLWRRQRRRLQQLCYLPFQHKATARRRRRRVRSLFRASELGRKRLKQSSVSCPPRSLLLLPGRKPWQLGCPAAIDFAKVRKLEDGPIWGCLCAFTFVFHADGGRGQSEQEENVLRELRRRIFYIHPLH